MIAALFAQASDWIRPDVDWHALAPELVLVVGINLVLLIDLWAFIPVVTLAVVGDTPVRSMFFDRYVVDEYALILKALFLLIGYVIVLMSQTELEEGGYYQGEYYIMLLASVLGMVMMASSRDLISVFVALELLSIPAYMMAAWRKRDPKSNEAGVKYYLLGVFASGVLLYGMSYLYGTTGTTKLTEIGSSLADNSITAMQVIAVVFVVVGFGFKVSAVPFHTCAPDTYEGAPLPVTAFLSVASKAAGFVGLITMLFLAMYAADGVYEPFIWVLAALTMTVGNVLALRQTNIVRMLAYSSVSQGGFILMPLAVIASGDAAESALKSVIIYLLIYAFSNLGAFAVIMAVSRKTGSGEISSFGGLLTYAPVHALMMTLFLASLTGIPPFGIWIAKVQAFKTLIDAGDDAAYALAIVAAVNTVISAAYYMKVMREMWMKPVPDGDVAPIATPQPIWAALGICAAGTLVLGILPGLVLRFADLRDLTGAFGP